jgi:hypothetical protein
MVVVGYGPLSLSVFSFFIFSFFHLFFSCCRFCVFFYHTRCKQFETRDEKPRRHDTEAVQEETGECVLNSEAYHDTKGGESPSAAAMQGMCTCCGWYFVCERCLCELIFL